MASVFLSLKHTHTEHSIARKHFSIPVPESHVPGPVDAKFLRLNINVWRSRHKPINYESLVTLQHININGTSLCNFSIYIYIHTQGVSRL